MSISCHIGRVSLVIAMTERDKGMRPMDEQEWLAARFEGHRTHLQGVAYLPFDEISPPSPQRGEGWGEGGTTFESCPEPW